MKHQAKGRKLGRKKEQRKALFKSLSNSLIKHGKIKTTEAKAKELRPRIEKLITRAKKNTLASRRILASHLSKDITKKMIDEVGPKYKKRNGGYTRITKVGSRLIDGSPMAVIELV